MSTAPAPTLTRRPLLDARDELGGADHLKAELLAGRQIGYRYDDVADKYIEISQAYWLDDSRANSTMATGIFCDVISISAGPPLFAAKAGWRYRCKVFVAPAETVQHPTKHAGGRPPVYDWVGFGIYLTGYIHNKGLPGTNQKKHLVTLMRDWFGKNGEGGIPKDTTMNQYASRILKELERD